MSEKSEARQLLIQIEKGRRRILQPYLEQLGLTFGQGHVRILDALLTKDHVTQKELADTCHIDVTTMSRSLDRLSEAGYLVRQRDPGCRRAFLICLTEEGALEARRVRNGLSRMDELLFQGLEPEELTKLKSYLMRLSENLEGRQDLE